MKRSWVFACVALSLGCGSGSGSGGGGAFTTSVPTSTPIDMLSPSQQATLCMDLETYSKNAVSPALLCRFTGIFAAAFAGSNATDAELQQACTAAVDACLSPDGGAGATTSTCNIPANCTATVAELSACASASSAAFTQLFAAIPTCSQLTKASLTSSSFGGMTSSPAEPASCKTFDMKCPGNNVFNGTGGIASSTGGADGGT